MIGSCRYHYQIGMSMGDFLKCAEVAKLAECSPTSVLLALRAGEIEGAELRAGRGGGVWVVPREAGVAWAAERRERVGGRVAGTSGSGRQLRDYEDKMRAMVAKANPIHLRALLEDRRAARERREAAMKMAAE